MFDPKGCGARPKDSGRKAELGNASMDNTKVAVTAIISGEKIIRGMCSLFRSACMNNVGMHILHADKWTGLGQKIEMVIAFLDYLVKKSSEKGESWIVMLVDGYDSLIQVDENEIKRRLIETGNRVLISSETNCFPWTNPLCNVNTKACNLFEQGPRRYPNAGGIIGEARSLRELLEEVKQIPSDMLSKWPGTDQGLFGQLLLTRKIPGYNIDVDSKIWATFTPEFERASDHRGTSWAAGIGGRV